jgi:hypothetical protein
MANVNSNLIVAKGLSKEYSGTSRSASATVALRILTGPSKSMKLRASSGRAAVANQRSSISLRVSSSRLPAS